jgi:hypothetical protein
MCLLLAPGASAEVFHSRESALRLAFPGADRVEERNLFLSAEDAADAGRRAGSPLGSRLVTVYVGWKQNAVMGHAFIDTHPVRTLPETVMIVIGTDGRVGAVHLLAFHEPPEYGPTPAWLCQFDRRTLDSSLSLRGDISGITGATLTANSITAAVRRTLATYQTALKKTTVDSVPSADTSAAR